VSDALQRWEDPGCHPVIEGIHRVPLPVPADGLRAVNVYVIRTPTGFVLVDSGWALAEARQLLVDALESLDGELEAVQRFLVTHVHRDHYAQAVQLRREFGTHVSVGEGERASVELALAAGAKAMEGQLERLRSLGAIELVRVLRPLIEAEAADAYDDWDRPDEWLRDGQTLDIGPRRLEIVSTPGHTQGHVIFHDLAAGVVFAGDHLLPRITPSIGFEPVVAADPLGDFMASLARVRARPDAMFLPAHGDVSPSVHRRVDELLEHHGNRLDATLTALAGGAETGWEVANGLTWTRRARNLDELDAHAQMLAVSETGAHLTVLLAQGRVRCEPDDGGVLRHTLV
jgi:glyoxylase-like metal-dependent hydrolase (beta-lactamase superfamily II)